ncbi:MAG: metal-dependent transcriptional regulator [Actinomycetota bacterium]|nr:metal-dependent transcriptional regulator [Actinomycetota bacterium]
MVSAATEDYLKTIFLLTTRSGGATVTEIAGRLGVSPPSVSAMCKRLSSDGLIERPSRSEVRLTAEGRRAALRVVRRHRLIETFLAAVLDMGWDEVHEEAEELEHVLSPRLEDRIAAYLGHPSVDPHGDPIPPSDPTTHDETWPEALSEADVGSSVRIDRVESTDVDALRYLDEHDLRPGVRVVVVRHDPFGGPVWLDVDGEQIALPRLLASMVHGEGAP